MHRLAIDIGNTRLKVALFSQSLIEKEASWSDFSLDALTDWLGATRLRAAIVCASGHVPAGMGEWLEGLCPVLWLTHETPTPLKLDYATPETLGRDRIAGAVGAYLIGGSDANCLKIDCGTCLTFDYISHKAVFMGGAISPGLQMRLDAMHHFTAKLPAFEADEKVAKLGKNTQTAMQSGAFWGVISEIQGRMLYFARHMNDDKPIHFILSGGDAPKILPNLLGTVQYQPHLVFNGLYQILTYNDL